MDGGLTRREPHRFSVADYHRMAETGILNEDSRVELINGRILDMPPIGAPHLAMVNRLTRLLPAVLAGRAILSVQNPVRLDDGSEPQPDVAVLRPRADDYETAVPRPADVLLLIEVADTSLADDRNDKLPLYAEHGIVECWLASLAERIVEIYREPRNGRYASASRIGPDDTLDIAALPGSAFAASDLLGPSPKSLGARLDHANRASDTAPPEFELRFLTESVSGAQCGRSGKQSFAGSGRRRLRDHVDRLPAVEGWRVPPARQRAKEDPHGWSQSI